MLTEAVAPNLAVIGLLLAITALPAERAKSARVLLVCVALLAASRYLVWRWLDTVPAGWSGGGKGIYVFACFVFELAVVLNSMIGTIVLSRTIDRTREADEHEVWARAQPLGSLPSVDVLIPTYDEGRDVLERTIVGATSLDYPNFTVWVLDDGRRPWVAELAAAKGARYLTRADNRHAKAGNINTALARTSAELVMVLDADFVVRRHALWRLVGFFRDVTVGIVQTPQYFFNKDPVQTNLGIADRWADDQRLFFDRIMPCRDAWGAAFCCGTGFLIRRSALEAIGGDIPTASICEDMLTSMELKRHGIETVFLKEELCIGLAPESVRAYFVQRSRWSRGQVQILFVKGGIFSSGLPLFYRLLFLPGYWLLQVPARIVYILLPLIFLLTGLAPLIVTDLPLLFGYLGPWILASIGLIWWIGRGCYFPILTDASALFMAIRVAPAALLSLVKPFGTPFRVTPKGASARGDKGDKVVVSVCLGLLFGTLVGIAWNAIDDWRVIGDRSTLSFATFWAILNCVVLGLTALIAREGPRRRDQQRFAIGAPARCFANTEQAPCRVVNLSTTGMFVRFGNHPVPEPGTTIFLTAPGIGNVEGLVVRRAGDGAGIRLVNLSEGATQALLALEREAKSTRSDDANFSTGRDALRVDIDARARFVSDIGAIECTIGDASLSGARLIFNDTPPARPGDLVTIDMPDVGLVSARVARQQKNVLGIAFEDMEDDLRDDLIRALYTVPRPVTLTRPPGPFALVGAMAMRLFGPDVARAG